MLVYQPGRGWKWDGDTSLEAAPGLGHEHCPLQAGKGSPGWAGRAGIPLPQRQGPIPNRLPGLSLGTDEVAVPEQDLC